MSSQHTPGPWKHGKPDYYEITAIAEEEKSDWPTTEIKEPEIISIAQVRAWRDAPQEAAANARLIAAAPELEAELERSNTAFQALAKWLLDHRDVEGSAVMFAMANTQFAANAKALAKANGEG